MSLAGVSCPGQKMIDILSPKPVQVKAGLTSEARRSHHESNRCPWAKTELDFAYHDHEWGVPLHDDRALFEFLVLEGAQAGLSWATILKKRENYRKAFDHFDATRVARYDARKVAI